MVFSHLLDRAIRNFVKYTNDKVNDLFTCVIHIDDCTERFKVY